MRERYGGGVPAVQTASSDLSWLAKRIIWSVIGALTIAPASGGAVGLAELVGPTDWVGVPGATDGVGDTCVGTLVHAHAKRSAAMSGLTHQSSMTHVTAVM